MTIDSCAIQDSIQTFQFYYYTLCIMPDTTVISFPYGECVLTPVDAWSHGYYQILHGFVVCFRQHKQQWLMYLYSIHDLSSNLDTVNSELVYLKVPRPQPGCLSLIKWGWSYLSWKCYNNAYLVTSFGCLKKQHTNYLYYILYNI